MLDAFVYVGLLKNDEMFIGMYEISVFLSYSLNINNEKVISFIPVTINF